MSGGLKAGAWSQEAYWLATPQLLSFLFYTIQDNLVRAVTSHSELVPLVSVISQENVPSPSLQASLMEAILQLRVPLPRWI